jgi:hypothetical protein
MSEDEREFAKDMEIGIYNFRNENYRGAEMRFRHALGYEPGQPEAMFELAESLDKLGKRDDAKQCYDPYLGSQPDGRTRNERELRSNAYRNRRKKTEPIGGLGFHTTLKCENLFTATMPEVGNEAVP